MNWRSKRQKWEKKKNRNKFQNINDHLTFWRNFYLDFCIDNKLGIHWLSWLGEKIPGNRFDTPFEYWEFNGKSGLVGTLKKNIFRKYFAFFLPNFKKSYFCHRIFFTIAVTSHNIRCMIFKNHGNSVGTFFPNRFLQNCAKFAKHL